MPSLYKKRITAGEPKAGSTICPFPTTRTVTQVSWAEVGIVEPIIEDGHIVPEWQPLGEGDSWEEAFADADAK